MKFSENTDTFDISKGDNSLFYFVGDLGSEEENKRFNEGLNNIKFDFVFQMRIINISGFSLGI